ncbi:hypothetical protein L207DRAFT_536679 [Hyaloscypha variabilis F]|uniref:Uncharacterized protein n=1 Tax=Hyaloscypha variabilis (strain UAMH 11265 / GT02V1 / F) TaxID=1149755 RepID=A0A2J6QZK6_HYAVF|nr:hypothetical protein L207DRAFT_536679 [Hyaloscypha variabilis F]
MSFGVGFDPYPPIKHGYDYTNKRITGSGPWWDRVQETLDAADNRAKYSEAYQQAYRNQFPESVRLEAEYKRGYVKGVTDTIRREEPQRRPVGIRDGWGYKQDVAEKRNTWVQRAMRDVDDHQKSLNDRVAAEQLKTLNGMAQRNDYDSNPPPPYQQRQRSGFQQK